MSEGQHTFRWPVRIYYEDTDGGGVVYHANYLKFFERARTEWLRSLGYAQTELRTRDGVLFVVRTVQIKYAAPARFDEQLEVVTKIAELGRSRIVFDQRLQRGGDLLTAASVEVACVASDNFKPVPIPATMRQHFESLQ
jgi:acyl-CoA thioester hydrolase